MFWTQTVRFRQIRQIPSDVARWFGSVCEWFGSARFVDGSVRFGVLTDVFNGSAHYSICLYDGSQILVVSNDVSHPYHYKFKLLSVFVTYLVMDPYVLCGQCHIVIH